MAAAISTFFASIFDCRPHARSEILSRGKLQVRGGIEAAGGDECLIWSFEVTRKAITRTGSQKLRSHYYMFESHFQGAILVTSITPPTRSGDPGATMRMALELLVIFCT